MNWLKFPPSGLPQQLQQETFACSCYAPVDALETQEIAITGVQPQYSRRWLAYVSGTDPINGNSEYVVFPIIKQYGLVLESSWPQRDDMSDAEYYTPPTKEQQAILLAEGQEWLKKWDVSFNYDVPFSAISNAPLIGWINAGTYLHFCEILSKDWYYDSLYHNGKIGLTPPFGFIIKYHQIIIKPKNMSNAIFYHKVGTQEFGFALPATTPESIKDKALNLGREDILKPDGSVDFTKAKEVTIL